MDDHSFDLRDWLSAVSIFRRLRPRLAPAPFQQRLCCGQPRPGRRIGIVHDFGQNRDRIGAMCTRQRLDVFLCVCCLSLHDCKLAAGMRRINPFVGSVGKLQEVLIPAA
jgi:hypothetical protein